MSNQQIYIMEPEPKPEPKEQEQDFKIKNAEGVCIKEAKVKTIHKIEHNVWFNRARRRFKKASYFSERA